ncbi:MAG: CotH kinase family protein [Lachnospiraceae bacterium]|nr:CotH kinase family protein [Lachnospiraceae bacterium]
MKKGKWIVLLASVCALFVFCVFQIRYEDKTDTQLTVLSQQKLNKLKERLKDVSGQPELSLSLSFAGEPLPYDAASGTFFLPLNMDTEEYESGGFEGTLNGEEASVLFEEDFHKRAKLDWMRENGKIPCLLVGQSAYAACSLTLTGMSVICFSATEYVTEEQPLFEMRVYDAETKKDWVTTCLATSRLRGNTSLAYDKKSLRLKLKAQKKDGSFEKVKKTLLGLREDDDWILNALYADDTKIKDKLANDLWLQTGAMSNPYGRTWGTQLEYVEVFMNDGYMGLYGLMYPIDRKQAGTQAVSEQLAAGKPVIERLYKKKYTAAWSKEDFIGALPDPNMPDFRGGFYVKGDTILQDESEWGPLYDLAACIGAEDAVFSSEITGIADQKNVLENWLFYNAIGGFDNYAKNYYYLVKDKSGQPYGYFVPWDLNLSFGDVYADNAYYAEFDESVVHDVIAWEPAQRMLALDVEDSRSLVKEIWQRWRSGVFATDEVLARMDELYDRLTASGAYERERACFPEGRYADSAEDMKRFEAERLAWLDVYIENLDSDDGTTDSGSPVPER